MTTATMTISALNSRTLMAVLAAAAFATIAFDIFGQALSPLAGFAKLAPVGLAKSTLKTVFGVVPKGSGEFLHFATGMIAYPIGWLLVARPLWRKIAPWAPALLAAAAYGVGLWVFALYVMAHLVTGAPAFLGFSGITWVALVGHVLYAVVFVAALQRRA